MHELVGFHSFYYFPFLCFLPQLLIAINREIKVIALTMAATTLKGYDFTYFNITSPSPGVAHVEINRPSKLNAFSEPVWLEFGRVFDQLSADSDIRVVVLSASGEKAFTAGLDVQAASAGDSAVFGESGKGDVARRAKGLRYHIEEFQGCVSAVERCEKREFGSFYCENSGLMLTVTL